MNCEHFCCVALKRNIEKFSFIPRISFFKLIQKVVRKNALSDKYLEIQADFRNIQNSIRRIEKMEI